MVSKRNMIIPHIEGNLSRGRYKDTYPTECPCCGHPTRVYARNADKGRMVETIHCDNPDCDSQVLRKFVHFAAKKAMNIEGLSESYLKRFQEKGWLSSFQDIYYLYHHRQEIVSMEGFGEKSYERLIDAIDKSRDTDFAHYLTAMDIPMIGRTKSRVLSRVFDGDLDAFEAAALGNYDFSKLEDFGETLNNNIHTWFADEDNRNLWRNLQDEMIFHIEGRKMDSTFYPVIYGVDEDDDWTDPKVWKKANPSLGITVSIDKVEAACESAKQNPGEENAFRQLRLNQWVKQAVRWMPMDKWDACSFNVNEEDLEGRVCYGGLDLSSTTDITAFVLVFPPMDEDDKFAILPYFWIPEDTLELRVRRDHVPYDVWEKQGKLMTTEGNVVHYGYIEKFIERLGERFNIREIAFDRWGAVQMVQNLEGMGFTVVPFGQGFKDMSPPTKELMKLTLEKKLAHGGHPVLRWMMANIFIRTDPAGNIKADKEKSTEKIDGAIATIMGLDRAIRCGNDVTASVYDERGILFI